MERICGTCAYLEFVNCIKPRRFGWYCDNPESGDHEDSVCDNHTCSHWSGERKPDDPAVILEYDEYYNLIRVRPVLTREIPEARAALEAYRMGRR